MSDYVFFVDSACDLPQAFLAERQIRCCPLSFTFDGETVSHGNYDLTPKEFFARLREGATARTSGVNVQDFVNAFEEVLKEEKDILYLGFSSALSITLSSARMAAEELKTEYPERKILIVDTLAASTGYGLLVRLTHDRIAAGATLEEAAQFAEDTKLSICHWFTVDDLGHLRRGGRIGAGAALLGSLLGIKPILHTDDEGRLVGVSKVRGRGASLKALCDKYGELSTSRSAPVYLCHADCMEDAEKVCAMMKEQYGVTVELIADIGPVIGAHTGAGTLSLFFVGKHR